MRSRYVRLIQSRSYKGLVVKTGNEYICFVAKFGEFGNVQHCTVCFHHHTHLNLSTMWWRNIITSLDTTWEQTSWEEKIECMSLYLYRVGNNAPQNRHVLGVTRVIPQIMTPNSAVAPKINRPQTCSPRLHYQSCNLSCRLLLIVVKLVRLRSPGVCLPHGTYSRISNPSGSVGGGSYYTGPSGVVSGERIGNIPSLHRQDC